MAVLDTTHAPDPEQVPYRDLALRYGAIWAVVGIFLTLISFLTNTEPGLPETSGMIKFLYGIVGIGVAVWAIVMVIRTDRDQQLGGFISLGRCLGSGTLTSLVAGIISAIYFFIHVKLVNPGYLDQLREATISQYEQRGLSETEIEKMLEMTSFFMSPVFMVSMQVIGSVFIGFIISLIAGLIMRREQPIS